MNAFGAIMSDDHQVPAFDLRRIRSCSRRAHRGGPQALLLARLSRGCRELPKPGARSTRQVTASATIRLSPVLLRAIIELEGGHMMIFVNYRREDSMGIAGRLHDRLAKAFGRKNLFMDVDSIPPGIDFVRHLNNQVASCDIFLAVIGPDWLEVKNEEGDRRLHAADDFVSLEISAALARDIPVIPILVDGARMPKASDLPEPLKPLVRRSAIGLRHEYFGRDADALIEKIYAVRSPSRSFSWKAPVGIVAALLLGGSMWYFRLSVPQWLPQAAQPVKQVEKEKPVTNQETRPLKQDEKEKPAPNQETQPAKQIEKETPNTNQSVQPPEYAEKPTSQDLADGLFGAKALGLDLSNDLTDELRSKYKIKDGVKGVLITAIVPNSQAAEKRLLEGDLILSMGLRPVSSLGQIGQVFNRLKKEGKKTVLVLVLSKGGQRFVTFNMQ
jgi:TIR domain